jgi:hypothetical protein
MDMKNILEKLQKNALKIVIVAIFSYSILWSAAKERLELGCAESSIFQLSKQCNDEKSIYVDGTKPLPDDSIEKLYERIENALSYHEKAGVWRRCLLLASACVFIAIFIMKFDCIYKESVIYFGALLLLLIFCVHYFFFNFINFHHMRRLKNNGIESLQLIKKKYEEYNK